jgi:hypothetical protein
MNDFDLQRNTRLRMRPWLAAASWAMVFGCLSSSLFCGTLQAQTAEKPKTGSAPEPQIQTRVLEDAGSRIEERPQTCRFAPGPPRGMRKLGSGPAFSHELQLRGHTQRIVVTPKTGALKQPYEIITGDGSRDLSPGVNTSRGAAGQRVWRVLDF